MTPLLSIIIPTHKRADILAKCLDYIEIQSIKEKLEVIVVSDGRDAKTASLFAKRKFTIPITFFSIPKSQQGVARNRGVEKAKGKYVLFIGDDIFLSPTTCEHHLAAHMLFPKKNIAVLGYTSWDPTLGTTPVMRWLDKTGWQFGFKFLNKYRQTFIPKERQDRFTYTSNISLPLKEAKMHPFLEHVKLYGWEDTEWGLRLKKSGIRLFYEPTATALHHHHITLDQSLKRMRTIGASAVQMEKLVPALKLAPKKWKLKMYRALAKLPTLKGKHAKAFLQGISSRIP